jgi:hypothetical protein
MLLARYDGDDDLQAGEGLQDVAEFHRWVRTRAVRSRLSLHCARLFPRPTAALPVGARSSLLCRRCSASSRFAE